LGRIEVARVGEFSRQGAKLAKKRKDKRGIDCGLGEEPGVIEGGGQLVGDGRSGADVSSSSSIPFFAGEQTRSRTTTTTRTNGGDGWR